MFESPPRYRVQSAKGPYVGYGVWDALGQSWLTETNLSAVDAMQLAADLIQAAAPRDVRHSGVRPVTPPRLTHVTGVPAPGRGLLSIWIQTAGGWLGYVLIDGAMEATWTAADQLAPADSMRPGDQQSTGA